MDDSDRNIMASLAHEPCEWHCAECGCCSWEHVSPYRTRDKESVEVDGETYCKDCHEGGEA